MIQSTQDVGNAIKAQGYDIFGLQGYLKIEQPLAQAIIAGSSVILTAEQIIALAKVINVDVQKIEQFYSEKIARKPRHKEKYPVDESTSEKEVAYSIKGMKREEVANYSCK